MRTPFPYLRNGWTDCAEIWYVVRDQLTRQCKPRMWYICTCLPLFRISGTAGRIALKFWHVVTRPVSYAVNAKQWWGASARVHVRAPFPYIVNGWKDLAEICNTGTFTSYVLCKSGWGTNICMCPILDFTGAFC